MNIDITRNINLLVCFSWFLRLRQIKNYTKEDLIKILQDLAQELGRVPIATDLRHRRDLPSLNTYIYHFSYWNKALEAADLNVSYKHYTNNELIVLLKELAEKLGRVPTFDDLKKSDLPSHTTYFERFGKYNNALKEAGLIE